jgi:hypothetical protein
MKRFSVLITLFLALINVQTAQASLVTYNVEAVFYEPQTQPFNSVFTGSFLYNSVTQAITGLTGSLTQSMTGDGVDPSTMDTVPLTFQLASSSDGHGGLLVSAFANNNTNVFKGGGYATGGVQYWDRTHNINYHNAYVTIDVKLNSDPYKLSAPADLSKLAYGDCTAGGMMGNACMTGHSLAGGGTMGAFPYSETIHAVPEPEEYAMMLVGFGLVGYQIKRKQKLPG